MPRASEGDSIEIEGKVIKALTPRDGEYGPSQFIVVKDKTGEQGCWLKLDSKEEDKISRGSSIKVKGKVKEYEDDKGKMKKSLNNCTFETEGRSPQGSLTGGNGKDDYWTKKFEWEKKRDIRNQLTIARECAFKAAVELVCSKEVREATFDKIFTLSDKIRNHYFKDEYLNDVKITGGEPTIQIINTTKEENIKRARDAVGETEFRPASALQKSKIFGHRNESGWHKGMIESRFITKEEIRKIGSPEKLSMERASEWLSFWWGVGDEIGERAKREMKAQDNEPIKKHLKEEEPIIKGDKTSLTKDVLVDEVYGLRRENFLQDDEKFREEMGYNPILEELSEEDLLKIKEILQHYHPKNWDEK